MLAITQMTNETWSITTATYGSSNNLTNQQIIQDHTPFKWIALSITIGILLFNIIVITLLGRRRKRTRMALFVQNLAFSDISVALFFLLPELLYNYFVIFKWSELTCKAYGYLHMTSFQVSTNAIIVLTIDRLFVIVYPLSMTSRTNKYRYGLTTLSWILGALMCIPYPFYYDAAVDVMTPNIKHCRNSIPNIKIELWISATSLIFLPLVIIVVCYCVMIHRIHNRNKKGIFSLRKEGARDDRDLRRSDWVSRTKVRTMKLLLVVVIAYVVCWSPMFCGSLLNLYEINTNSKWTSLWYALAPLNSLANPLIFLIFNVKMFQSNSRRSSKITLLRDNQKALRPFSSNYKMSSATSSILLY